MQILPRLARLSQLRTIAQHSKLNRLNRILSTQCNGGRNSSQTATGSEDPAKSLYGAEFSRSINNPLEFWEEASNRIHWFKPWEQILDTGNYPFQRWFVKGELNICYDAIDRHVESGRANQVAVIHDSPVTNTVNKITYAQLKDQVSRFAGVLRSHGVKKGDRVVVYMPMIPEGLVAMLACARIGAVHCLVFGGFSAKELSIRIKHSGVSMLVTANYGVELSRKIEYLPIVNEALRLVEATDKCKVITHNRPETEPARLLAGQLCYQEEMDKAQPVDCVPLESNDPLYILYTSGTTGNPKGVVRSHGGYAVALAWCMDIELGLKPGEVWWGASDLGWIVGHTYSCYGPFLNGNTTILYEGKPIDTPDSGAYFRVLQQHNVVSMFTAPTAMRAIKNADPDGTLARTYSIPNFRALHLAGERCDVTTLRWCKRIFRTPVFDQYGQTEAGRLYTATCLGLENEFTPPEGSAGRPVPGWNLKVLQADGTETNVGELGNIAIKMPLPPGFVDTLYNNEEKYKEYFARYPGYYDTSDSGTRDSQGYISVLARTDDIINVAGRRLSTSALEEAVMRSGDVAECAVVGIKDSLKGHIPLGFCVPQSGHSIDNEDSHRERIIECVRKHIGPVAAFRLVVFIPALPKTRSGKIPRKTLAALADGEHFKIPATIEDATVYEKILPALQSIGYPKLPT